MPNVPANAKKPDDHKTPIEKEVEDGPIEFEYDGKRYELPSDPTKWPVAATLKLGELQKSSDDESGMLVIQIAMILLTSIGTDPNYWRTDKLFEWFDAYEEKAGFNEGE